MSSTFFVRCVLFVAAVGGVPSLLSRGWAEHDGKVQILLLGDSTTEGSIPRLLRPDGPHLETVIEQNLSGGTIC